MMTSKSERIIFCGQYGVVNFDQNDTKRGEEITVYNPEDLLLFVVDDVRQLYCMYPEDNYIFKLLLPNECDNDSKANHDLLPELQEASQLLDRAVDTSHKMSGSSLMASSAMKQPAKKISIDLVVKPLNFIFVPVVLCSSDQFPKKKLILCPTASQDIELRRIVVAIHEKESFCEILKRILSQFLSFFDISEQDVNISDVTLSLHQEDGAQHVDGSTLQHNEVAVLKLQNCDKALLNHMGIDCCEPNLPHPTIPLLLNACAEYREPDAADDDVLIGLKSFLMNSGMSDESIINLRKTGETLDDVVNYYLTHLEDFMVLPSLPAAIQQVDIPSACHRECKICLESFPMEQMYILNCHQNHAFCICCLSQQVHINMTPSSDSAGFIPACPCANGQDGCRYTLTLEEIEQIMRLALDDRLISVVEVENDLKRARKMFFVASCISAGNVCCPNCPSSGENDGVWFEVPGGNFATGSFVDCPQCQLSFCCKCRASPYHFKCSCKEVVAYERFWLEWNISGLKKYQEHISARDAEYRDALERARVDHEMKVADARRKFEATKASEQTMARTYKMCPQCNTPIEHISGCDLMVCGRDYHGNPIGNGSGCGANFRWSTAPSYQPRTGEELVPAEIEMVEPERAKDVAHFLMEGLPLKCDHCGDAIIGPIIRCINCRSFDICFRCSSTVNFGSDPHEHNNAHICAIIFES